jgi:hypothetical protein
MFLASLCALAHCTPTYYYATAVRAKPHCFNAIIAANLSRSSSGNRSEDGESSCDRSEGSEVSEVSEGIDDCSDCDDCDDCGDCGDREGGDSRRLGAAVAAAAADDSECIDDCSDCDDCEGSEGDAKKA